MRVKVGGEIIPVFEEGIDVLELFKDTGVVRFYVIGEMLVKQVRGIQEVLEVVLVMEEVGDVGGIRFFVVELSIGEGGVEEGGEAGGVEMECFIAEEGKEEGVEAGEVFIGIVCHDGKV